MSIDLPVVFGGKAAEDQKPLVARSLFDLFQGTLGHSRYLVNAPRTVSSLTRNNLGDEKQTYCCMYLFSAKRGLSS